jgi:tetratricopeptide (TPR) repeat protein
LALRGQWRFCLVMDKLSVAIQIAERGYSLAQEQNDAALKIGACAALAVNLFFLGDFGSARQYARHGVQIWRSGGVEFPPEDLDTPVVGCLCHGALSEWHLGEIASYKANMEEAISLAKELNDMNALGLALEWAAMLGNCERNPAEVERLASELIELSTRHNFSYRLAQGTVYRGWARSASGDAAEGISSIEQGIRDLRATGAVLTLPIHLPMKAEALYLADRTSEALEAINEAIPMAERLELGYFRAEMHRLRGVFLATLGAEETQIEAPFQEAIRIAREQKAVSLERRAEATCAEYRRQKASASGGRGIRLPLW